MTWFLHGHKSHNHCIILNYDISTFLEAFLKRLESFYCQTFAVNMAKRVSSEASPAAKKRPCSSKCTTQSTLHMFFKNHDGDKKPKPKTIEYSPEFFGLHMYSEEDIHTSVGLDKTYKEFWNAKVQELCKDEKARHKLKDKAGIQGAINTIWTLHKSDLLKIQVEELTIYVSQVYDDEFAMINYLSSVEANKEKVMELTESLRLLYVDATDESGPEVSDILKELRKAQGALKKAIERKQLELQPSHDQPLIALPSETLSAHKLHDIVTEIKETVEFHPDSDITISQYSDSNMEDDGSCHRPQDEDQENNSVVSESPVSSRSGSPVIPLLSGLDTYKLAKN